MVNQVASRSAADLPLQHPASELLVAGRALPCIERRLHLQPQSRVPLRQQLCLSENDFIWSCDQISCQSPRRFQAELCILLRQQLHSVSV